MIHTAYTSLYRDRIVPQIRVAPNAMGFYGYIITPQIRVIQCV